MKLWLLRPVDGADAWQPGLGMALGFVVRAETEVEARLMACAEGGDETGNGRDPWFDAELSTCVELVAEGQPGVVICDFVGMHDE